MNTISSKKYITKIKLLLVALLLFSLCACDKSEDQKVEEITDNTAVVNNIEVTNDVGDLKRSDEVSAADSESGTDAASGEVSDVTSDENADAVSEENPDTVSEENAGEGASTDTTDASTTEATTDNASADNTSEKAKSTDNSSNESEQTAVTSAENKGTLPPIIMLGDSLTQGSLGDDNGNSNNPQAPWRVIANNHGVNIIGYGYYGYVTHDVLWRYGEDGGKKDKNNIYVFWVGSNDFVQSATGVNDTIAEINKFVSAGGIDKYIVMGTTDRPELGRDKAVEINGILKGTYGSKYMDILKYVEYGPDNVHLTAASYSMIGEAVYNKIVNTYQK